MTRRRIKRKREIWRNYIYIESNLAYEELKFIARKTTEEGTINGYEVTFSRADEMSKFGRISPTPESAARQILILQEFNCVPL